MYFDFDSYKNQEWLRRRKLRIEQVRKQSSHIAKILRQKALNEGEAMGREFKKTEEAKFRFWKAEKLDEMERRLRCALEEFGLGYKLAESEPEPNEIIRMKNMINKFRAQERGEIAMEEELKKKKIEEEKKNYSILRKQMTRKLENLRSALICSVSNQKDLINLRRQKQEITFLPNHQKQDAIKENINATREKYFDQIKIPENSDISKKVIVQKKPRKSQPLDNKQNFKAKRNSVNESEFSSSQLPVSTWINLDSLEIPVSSRSSRMTSKCTKFQKFKKEKINCTIEFYDHPSRYYCKSSRDYNNLVEKINPEYQYDAVGVTEENEVNKNSDVKMKNELDVSQERGSRALRREKINRDCSYMMEKLGELQKKEKVLKAQQRVPSDFVYMSDKRLSERIKTKQRIMESKFENIYHEATSGIISEELHLSDSGNEIANTGGTHFGEEPLAKLSFSPGNLKTTSPVTSLDVPLESPIKTSPSVRIQHSKKKSKKKKRKLLCEIDKTLEEGRKLRKKIIENRASFQPNLKESSDVEEKATECLHDPEIESSSHVIVESQGHESKIEELKINEVVVNRGIELKPLFVDIGAKTGDVSLPLSTSTSYKSPPSTVRSYGLRKFLDCLEDLNEVEEDQSDSKFKGQIQKLLNNVLSGTNSHWEESNLRRPCKHANLSRNLEYYVLKLLNMSRECIANLSVSTLNDSSPTITDLGEEQDNEKLYSEGFFKASNSEEDSRLRREEEHDQSINNWTSILEHDFGNLRKTLSADHKNSTNHSSLEKEHFFQQCEMFRNDEISESEKKEKFLNTEEAKASDFSSVSESKYERITQRCSERISELSNMLEKVRKDKEKLLYSTSGGSSFTFKNERIDADLPVRGQEIFKELPAFGNIGDGDHLKNFTVLETFIDSLRNSEEVANEKYEKEAETNMYNLSRKNRGYAAAKEDSQSFRNPEESMTSLESLPDVMDKLLEKEIITSPFKWSREETSPKSIPVDEIEWKSSSIEKIVNNFRKEMSRVKSLSVMSSDTVPRLSSSIGEGPDDVPHFETSEFIPFVQKKIKDSNKCFFHEESSVESINHALTRLGLNWAKSILTKNDVAKAMSSTSSSDLGSSEKNSPR